MGKNDKNKNVTQNEVTEDVKDEVKEEVTNTPKGKFKFKFTGVDIIIIVVIIATAAGVYNFISTNKVISKTKTIRYSFELLENQEGFTDLIKVGDNITDGVRNYNMGKVVEVSAEPYTILVADRIKSHYTEVALDGYERSVVTVEAKVTDEEDSIKVDGVYTIRGGQGIAVKGNGYSGYGFILSVERGDD